jgi:hypothetical protein
MKATSFFTAALLAITTSASPAGKSSFGTQQLATFDDLPGVPAVSEINPVGTYKGLKYNSFNVLVSSIGRGDL